MPFSPGYQLHLNHTQFEYIGHPFMHHGPWDLSCIVDSSIASQEGLKSFEMGQKEVALQNEEAERQAEIRKDEIIGSLEATYMELTGNSMPGEGQVSTTATAEDIAFEEDMDEYYDSMYD